MSDDVREIDDDEAPKDFMGRVGEVVRSWGPAIFAVLFVRTFAFEPFRIPSGSMVPTVLIGDHVAVSKFSYAIWVPATLVDIPFLDMLWVAPRFRLLTLAEPQRGDIVVFRFPVDESVNYIKRVVGLPGDRIRVRDNQIYVNGQRQEQTLVGKFDFVNAGCHSTKANVQVEDFGGRKHHVLTSGGFRGLSDRDEVVVPPDSYFVMGDNRNHSEDSRKWGFVRADQIKGKAHVVWLSWDGCDSGAGAIRTERLFHDLYSLELPD